MERYLLDTSAIFALRDNEPGADQVEKILRETETGKCHTYVSFMTFMELFYVVWRQKGKGEALRTFLEMKMLPLERVEMSDPILLLAGELKATFPLSLADSWIAATAIDRQATLIHKDPEFEPLKERLTAKTLPYKLS